MPDSPVTPLTEGEIEEMQAFYIDRTSTRLRSGLNPSVTIPRLLATLAAARAESPEVGAVDGLRDHPEATCQRCGRPNVRSWHAPSPLWNAVLRNAETGDDEWGVLCPPCFSELAESSGVVSPGNRTWDFKPHGMDVAPLWADSQGRTWDPEQCLWVAATPPSPVTSPDGLRTAERFAAEAILDNALDPDSDAAIVARAALRLAARTALENGEQAPEGMFHRADALRVLELALQSNGITDANVPSVLRDIEEGGYTLRLTTDAERTARNQRGYSR